MSIALYIDEDSMSAALVAALRSHGVDVLTALEAEMIARPDRDHLEFATDKKRTVFTFNVADFFELHTEFLENGVHHRGIIFGKQQYSTGEQLRRLLKLFSTRTAEEISNHVEFLSAWK